MKKRFPVQVVLYYDGQYKIFDNVVAIGFYRDESIFEMQNSDGFNTVALDNSRFRIMAVNDLE